MDVPRICVPRFPKEVDDTDFAVYKKHQGKKWVNNCFLDGESEAIRKINSPEGRKAFLFGPLGVLLQSVASSEAY